jgi:hypothetical protein
VLSTIEKYAKALLAALNPGRGEPRPDYVFGIDDLELVNRDQPKASITAFRHAVAAELASRRRTTNADRYDKFEAAVKEQCSFHLFVPMTEAYFFGDADALRTAGCTRQAILVPDSDVEQFQTTDPDYLAPPRQPPPSWAIDLSVRHLHPKRYLQFLLDPTWYGETSQGVDALLSLDWNGVLARPRQTLFLRSLFQDLADAVGEDMTRFPGDPQPLTSDYSNRNRILRNL